MAAANNRFSIRDYAAKRRIVDIAKAWPFFGGKDGNPSLPPISISRFRWWTDELSSTRSAAEEAEPVGDAPKSPLTTTTKKTRVGTKKRSIVELFASAPQIEPSAADGDGKEVMRKWKGKVKKGVLIKMENRGLKKEKICKPKSHLLQDPINNMRALRKTAQDVVGGKKKFMKLKTLQKKNYILQTSNIMSCNLKSSKKLPVRGILKNKNRVSAKRTRKIDNAKTVEVVKRCCKTTRHVTFSEKDDILGHSKKCSSIDLPQFKSLCKIFSDVLTKSSVMNNSSKVNADHQVVNASVEETNAWVVDRTDESSSQKNQSNDSLSNVNHVKLVNSSNSSCSNTEKATMDLMIDLNHAMETSNDLDCFNPSSENLTPKCTNSCDLDFKCTIQRKESNIQEGLEKTSLPSSTLSEGTFFMASNATNFLSAVTNPSSHSSTSCLIGCNEMKEKYFHVDMNCYHHIPENNICFSMESNKLRGSVFMSNSASTSQNKRIGEDFNGLPLHKQGELIQMHSGTKFVEPYKKQNLDLAYSHGFYAGKQVIDAASYQNDQLDWCQNQYYPTRDRRFTEFNIKNNEPVKNKYEFLHSDANKTKVSFYDEDTIDFFKRVDLQRQCNLACQLEPKVQPTIRLMGQDVVVGSSTNRDRHASIMPQEYLSKQQILPEFIANKACGISKDRLHKLLDPPSIFYHTTRHVEPQFDSHIEDHGSQSLSRKNNFSTTRSNIFKQSISGEESIRHQYYPTTTFVTPQSLHVHENLFQPQHLQHSGKLPSSLYFCQTDLSQPYRFSGTHLIPHRPPYNMHMVPFSCDNISHTKASTFTSNSSQSSFISVISAANSTSEVTKSNAIKNKERERPYSNFTGFNSPVDTHKIPKHMYSAKRHYFEKQANYSSLVEQQEANLLNEVDELSNSESFQDWSRNQK